MTRNHTTAQPPRLLWDRELAEIVFPVAVRAVHERGEETVAGLARMWDLPIRMVHVSNSIEASDPELEAFATRFRKRHPDLDVRAKHLYGDDPGKAIAEAVEARSLLFLTTEHADEWKVKGSIAEVVLRDAGVPLLAVGPNAKKFNPAGEVVIGLDGSASAEFALPVAHGFAQALGTRLWLVRVIPTPKGEFEHHPEFSQYLEEQAAALPGPGQAGWEIIQSNDPVEALEDFAASRDAAVIVAAARDRSNVTRTTMGSITMGLIATARRPVLTVEVPETPVLDH